MIQDPLALAAVICGLTAFGFWLEGRFGWARTVGASLLAIFFGALLSNLQLVPAQSPVYDFLGGPVTSLAIVWLLLGVSLKDVKAAGPSMLLAFALAVTATAVGALTATLALGAILPGEPWRLAGVLTGTYAGGSLNFVAVAREVGLEESIFAATAAADNVLTALWMGATLMLPLWLGPLFARRRRHSARGPGDAACASEKTEERAEETAGKEVERQALDLTTGRLIPFDLLALGALGLGLLFASERIALAVPAVPSIVWLTSLALLAAQLPAVRKLEGAFPLGLVALNLFFVLIGIGSRFAEIFRVGPQIFVVTALVVLIHGLVLYGAAWLLRLDAETTSVASQAAIGGPSTAMALAIARGWPRLTLPGVLVGLLGYAVGNYVGLLMAALVRSLG